MKKLDIKKIKRRQIILLSLFSILLFMFFINPPLENWLTPVRAYNVIEDNSVDADSDVDVTANIGTDGSTSYINAQSKNDDDQIIQEGNGAGYVAGNDVNELHDQITNTQDPADVGTYSADANMQTKDGTDNLLTEAQGAGYVAGNDIEHFINGTTNQQDPTDLGTYSDWTEMQDQDGTYNTLTEENVPSAGVNEYKFVDTCPSLVNWDSSGSTPYLNAVDTTNTTYTSGTTAFSVWIEFAETSGTGTGFTVNMSTYADNTDADETLTWELDWTSDGVAESTNSWTPSATPSWQDAGTISGLDTQAEIDQCRIRYSTTKGTGQPGTTTIDAARLGITQSGADNYRFDREFYFTELDFDEIDGEELCIYVNTAGAETLDIDVWTGSWTDIGTDIVDANDNSWVNISVTTWLTGSTLYFRFEDATTTGDTSTADVWILDGVLIHSWTVAVDDYEFDREFAMTGIVTTDDTNEELTIFMGTCAPTGAAEKLDVYIWESSAWVDIGDILATDDDTWINISIVAYLDTANEYFSLRDGDQALDTDSTTWEIDYVAIHTWTVEVLDYELNWEHQAQAVDTKDSYNLTIYGFSSDAETISIWVWNASDTTWYDTNMDIGTAEQWYNFTFTSAYYGCNGSTITWNYRGDSESGDTTQTTLRIDYSGIRYWNFTTNLLETTIVNADYKQGIGWELFDNTPFAINVTSGVTYDIQIKGVDGSGSPIANEYLRFNTINNPATGTNLTTSYITLYSDQTLGIENQHDLYIWCAVPFGVDDQVLTFTLYIQILES